MTATATSTKPTTTQHTFTITVDVDDLWIEYVTQHNDIFGRTYYAGYWARGIERDLELGWLVAEMDSEERYPGKHETERAIALWRAGQPLPTRWYRLDRATALKMWEEGVKLWGVGWYDAPEHDGSREDVLLQMALLGEVRYG
jgi:hypothetical protein